jgi:hypothetical protein
VIGARASWTDILRARPAAGLRRAEARRARGGVDPDPEHGHVGRQSLQCLAGRRRRAAAAGPRRGGGTGLGSRPPHPAARRTSSSATAGPRASPDELSSPASRSRRSSTSGASHFLKLGARSYLVISIAMVATRGGARRWRAHCPGAVAVGACSAVAQRLRRLETALAGRRAGGKRSPRSPTGPSTNSRRSTTCAAARWLPAQGGRRTRAPRAAATLRRPARKPVRPAGRRHERWTVRAQLLRPQRRPVTARSRPAAGCRRCCATSSARPAPRSAATPAIAAPAR